MGLCGSSLSAEDQAEKGADKKLEQTLKEQQAADQKVSKLLLLGQREQQTAHADRHAYRTHAQPAERPGCS
jgi:hypothetical protein